MLSVSDGLWETLVASLRLGCEDTCYQKVSKERFKKMERCKPMWEFCAIRFCLATNRRLMQME